MKKLIILLIIVSSFINSCCKVKFYIIPEKEKFQMNLGDTMIYKSQSGISDTLFIAYKNEEIVPDNEYNYRTNGECNDNDWHEDLLFRYMRKKDGLETEDFSVYQGIKNKKVIYCVIYGKTKSFDYIKHKQITLNKTKYKNVLEFDLNNNNKIKVLLNAEFGILSYKYDNEETFLLDDYIKSDL